MNQLGENCIVLHFGSQSLCAGYYKGEFTPLAVNCASSIPAVVSYSDSSYQLDNDELKRIGYDYLKYPLLLFGLTYNDYSSSDLSNVPFGRPIVSGFNSLPRYSLSNGTCLFCEEVITKMIECVCKMVTEYVEDLSIVYMAIPSYYGFNLRNKLRSCIQDAGYSCGGFLTESEAAVLHSLYSFYSDCNSLVRNNVYFVFSMEYLSCEGCLVVVENATMTHYPIFHTRKLGGFSFDQAVLDYCVKKASAEDIDLFNGNRERELPHLLRTIQSAREMNNFSIDFDEYSVTIDDDKLQRLFEDIMRSIKQGILDGFVHEKDRSQRSVIARESVKNVVFLDGATLYEPLKNEVFSLFRAASMDCSAIGELKGFLSHVIRSKSDRLVDIRESINTSVGIGLNNGRVRRVIPAGSCLPFKDTLPFECDSANGKFFTAVYSGDMYFNTPLIQGLRFEFQINRVIDIKKGHVHNLEVQLTEDGKLTIAVISPDGNIIYKTTRVLSIF